MNPLIQNSTYLTQFGQLRQFTRDEYGDLSQTSVTTVACLVYLEGDEQSQTNPVMTNVIEHRLVLPYSVRSVTTLKTHISQVTDKFGNVVLSDARIDKIIDYNHWRYAPRFFVCNLDLELDGA